MSACSEAILSWMPLISGPFWSCVCCACTAALRQVPVQVHLTADGHIDHMERIAAAANAAGQYHVERAAAEVDGQLEVCDVNVDGGGALHAEQIQRSCTRTPMLADSSRSISMLHELSG